MPRKRAPRATPEQFEEMVNFMTTHSCLVHPKTSNSLPSKERKALWAELCDNLNNKTFGPKKTISLWQRAWTDLKSEVKAKLSALHKKGQWNNRETLLNPCQKKVANLLAKASSQCAFVEQRGVSMSSLPEQERDVGIKFEESINHQHLAIEGNTGRPCVVSLSSSKTQSTEAESRNFVKCEETAEYDSSDLEDLTTYVDTVNSNEDCQSLEDTVNPAIPVFNKRKTKHKRRKSPEDLCNLIEIKKEKSDRLLAIANAVSSLSENQEKLLKIEEERNRLIQQRNTVESERNIIENDRNALFKSIFEHLISRDVLTLNM